MPEIQQPDLTRQIRESFGIRGPADFVLSPEIVPVAIVKELAPVRDFGARDCLGTMTQAAVAGEYSGLYLYNPNKSGVTVEVQKFHLRSATQNTTVNIRKYSNSSFGTTKTTKAIVDFRDTSSPVTDMQAASNVAQLGNAFGYVQLDNYGSLIFDLKVVLGYQQGVLFMQSAVNVALAGSFWWRETPIRPEDV